MKQTVHDLDADAEWEVYRTSAKNAFSKSRQSLKVTLSKVAPVKSVPSRSHASKKRPSVLRPAKLASLRLDHEKVAVVKIAFEKLRPSISMRE
jgi:hypothetical protein